MLLARLNVKDSNSLPLNRHNDATGNFSTNSLDKQTINRYAHRYRSHFQRTFSIHMPAIVIMLLLNLPLPNVYAICGQQANSVALVLFSVDKLQTCGSFIIGR